MESRPTTQRDGDLEIDGATGQVTDRDGRSLRLSPINMAVLECLLDAQGEVVSRATLFGRVWPKQVVSDDVLTRAISDVRQQLKSAFGPMTFIETLPKRGYRWALANRDSGDRPGPVRGAGTPPAPIGEDVRAPRSMIARLGIYLAAALLLASAFVWFLDTMTAPPHFRVAIFPPDTAGSTDALRHELDELLTAELMNLDRVQVLSPSAVAARPAQPFPYMQSQLGADRVVESRLRIGDRGRFLLSISVVDARTGIVDVSRSMEVEGDRAGLAGGVRQLVSEIRTMLLTDAVP